MKRHPGRAVLALILILLIVPTAVFLVLLSGRYTEEDTPYPDTVRIRGLGMRWYGSEGEEEFRSLILLFPDFGGLTPGRWRIVTLTAGEYPFQSSELLYFEPKTRRLVLSSLVYDAGVTETVFVRGGAR